MAYGFTRKQISVGLLVRHPLFCEAYGVGTIKEIRDWDQSSGGCQALVSFESGPTIWLKLNELKQNKILKYEHHKKRNQ